MDNHWKNDIIAGFIVFLIALPLSIGIALAAGVPASAGILSAILGGIIATVITGGHITISGPAAGLIVVISSSVITMGDGDLLLGFKRTLAATVIVGILQILLGLLRLGKLTFMAPTSVVHGMLAAIGIIIIVKQLPVLMGSIPHAKSIPGIILELPSLLMHNNALIFLIGIICFILLVVWRFLPAKINNLVPAPLVAVAIGLAFSYGLNIGGNEHHFLFGKDLFAGNSFLVLVPNSLKDLFIFPEFDIIFSGRSLINIMTIFVVGSLESLLSAFAVDKIDPFKRKSNLDKDIIGKGITNIFCGALGAYPIITEIVRSSANISNGAKTKWSNFFHGIFILVFVAILPGVINHIPLSALAAVLILVGFNLAHPKEFIHVWHTGKEQFFFFVLTIVVTLVEDLLIGISVGIIANIIYNFTKGVKLNELFNPLISVEHTEEKSIIHLNSNIVFLGYLKLKKMIDSESYKNTVELDKGDFFVDYTASELLKEKITKIK